MRIRARGRRLAIALTGVAAVACALTAPASAAHASAGSYTPNSHQWYFSQWGIQQNVWPTTEGAGVTVAVVDGGVQPIPDLQGALIPGGDVLGYPGNGEKDYAPNGGHGTAVAALIAGQGVNGNAVGIAPQAKILPVHVVDPTGDMSTSLPQGIKYAVDHGAGVINVSLGQPSGSATSCDPSLQQAVSYALGHNVVVVAASGDNENDDSSPIAPASCAGVLAVGGVEPNHSLWPGSTQGLDVSVAAPGDKLYTPADDGTGVSYTSYGTSFAAPLVSAAAALIRAANPSMPWYTIDQRLTATATPVGQVPNSGVGFGIININKALHVSQYPVSASSPNPTYARYQNWLKSTGQSSSAGGASGSSSQSSSGKSSVGLIIGIAAVVVIAAVILVIVLANRGRSRRGPRIPGGGYPPGGYGAPGQQYPHGQPPGQYPQGPYPPPGQAAPPGGQYPQPGQYAPPGQQPGPGPYSPPGQYPPPRQ